jgi:hypothetical protein
MRQLRVLPDWAGSERVRGTFPGILRALQSLPSRPEPHRVRPRGRGKLRGVCRRQIQDSHGDSSVRPMRGCSSVPARVLPHQLWRRLSRDLRRVRRLRGWRVPDRVRLALARTMHYMSARHVQDQRRIRALRDVRARLHSWPASERMQLKFRVPSVYGLHRRPGKLLRVGILLRQLGGRNRMPARILLPGRSPGQAAVRSRHLLRHWLFDMRSVRARNV